LNLYSKKQRWKLLLFIAAILIIGVSLWYSNLLVRGIAKEERSKVKLWADAIQKKAALVKYTNEFFTKIKVEERKKVELWAKGTKQLADPRLDMGDVSFIFEVIKNNETVPVILADDKGNIISSRNLDSTKQNDKVYLKAEMEFMRQQQDPIEINIINGQKNYLYYKDSRLFSELKVVFDGLIKSFISEVALNSASVPVIYIDSTKKQVMEFGNIDTSKIKDPEFIKETLADMEAHNAPIEIDLGEGGKSYIYYQESMIVTQLKYYPYVQLGIIGLFLIIAYSLFSTSRRMEQNQVWVGMAKETAHQLGTPLSSLIAWLEYFKDKGLDAETTKEIAKDIKRLESITERFSKIGSVPVLNKLSLNAVLKEAVDYMRTRTSKNIIITITSTEEVTTPINAPLFEWVIENLLRNAADAMDGSGAINIVISDQMQFAYIDISDTGKGLPKSKFKTIFEPGFTTKQRGWGLGLSLCKRIIENYHSGKIFVKSSEPGKGTTFRIVLNK